MARPTGSILKNRRMLIGVLIIALIAMLTVSVALAADRGAWAPNVSYAVNDTVTYQDATHPNHKYQVLQAHTSLTGWEPPYVPALFKDLGAVSGTATTPPPTTPPATTPPATTPPPTTPPPTSSGTCWTPWVSTTAYNGGAQVSRFSQNYQAAYWTQGNDPATSSGPAGSGQPWIPKGSCTGGSTPPPTTPPPTTPPATTPPPTTPPPTTTTPTPGLLPKHLITGYWQNFTGNGARALRLRDVPTSYALVAVAFADATGTPGQVAFTLDSQLSSALGGYTVTDFKNDIATLHGQGRKVIISVGGQNGTVSVSDATSATNFANSVYSIMTTYGFDGVDIDLENGLNPTYMESALRQLRTKAGTNLIITMAPETIFMQSPTSTYLSLAIKIKDILTIVNTQYYNSGSMLGCDGKVYSQGTVDFITAQACIALQNGLRPDQVGLGLPANSSGAGSGAVAPSVVNNALDCLARGTNCGTFHPPTTYPSIRGAMTWDVNWDANASYNFANTIYPHLSTLP